MELLIRFFAPIFFLVYMVAAFVWPSVRTYRQTGVNPITFGKSDDAHDFIGKWFKILVALIPIAIAAYLTSDQWYSFLLPARYMESRAMQFAGIALCVVSFVWTVVAQYQMGNSWRIGIDEKNKTELVHTGLFGISRNPIFTGMLATLLGFFLILPNAVTFLVFVAGYLLIQIQIRIEEAFLQKQFGEPYYDYCKRVRRFL